MDVDRWDALVDRSPGASPWARPGWVEAWWRAFGRGRPEVRTVRRFGGRLAALVPLARGRGGLSGPANYHTPAFEMVGEDEAALGELADAVLADGPPWLRTRFIPRDGPTAAALRAAARAHGYRLVERTLERSPYVDTAGGWDAYEAGLGAKLRRELRRRRRRLEDAGRVEVVVSDGRGGDGGGGPGAGLDELLTEGFRVEGMAWKADRGTAIESDPATARFYRDVARWAAGRGTLRLAFLRLDGRPLAFDLAMEEGGRHYLLKCGYDPGFRALGPGMILRYAMLERAFRVGVGRYDFLGADEPWKRAWASATTERVELSAFRRSPAGLGGWAAVTYGRPLAAGALRLVGR